MTLRIGPAILISLVLAGPASAAEPTYTTVKLPGAGGGQEPRIAVGRDDVRYAGALKGGGEGGGGARGADPGVVGSNELVSLSREGGRSGQRTASDPPQRQASIDVDIVTMPTGRILSSELDY